MAEAMRFQLMGLLQVDGFQGLEEDVSDTKSDTNRRFFTRFEAILCDSSH